MYYENLLILVVTFLLFSSTAHAILIDNLDGTVTQIRSDGSQLMWMQDANYAKTSGFDTGNGVDGNMLWGDAKTWAEDLIFAGHDDWRLTSTLHVNSAGYVYEFSVIGTTDIGYRSEPNHKRR